MARGNWPSEPVGGVVIYLTYHIYSRDYTDTEALRATYGDYGVLRSPAFMRDALGIDEAANPDTADRWITFVSPPAVISSTFAGAWLPPRSNQDAHAYVFHHKSGEPDSPYWWPPEVADNFFDYNFDWIQWDGHPSIPIWGAGPKVTWIWSGMFLAKGGRPTEDAPPLLATTRTKRFMIGFELLRGGEGTFAEAPEGMEGTAECYSRDASRTPDGIGLAVRDGNSSNVQMDWDRYISPGSNLNNAWERFYIRVRKYPTANEAFWECTSASSSVSLEITSTGTIEMFTTNQAATKTGPHFTTVAIPIGEWKKLDLYVVSRITGGDGLATLSLYIGNIPVGEGTGEVRTDAVLVNWQISRIGAVSTPTFEMDFDDWDNKDPGHADDVTAGSDIFPATVEWRYGTHCQQIRPIDVVAQANWTGDWQTLLQNPSWRASSTIVSSTSGARLEVETEMNEAIVEDPIVFLRQLGCVAFIVGYVNNRSGGSSATGLVGYKLAGGADVSIAQSEANGLNGYSALANISAGIAGLRPLSTTEPLTIFHTKSTDATTDNLKHLQVLAMFLGSWGPEDEFEPDNPIGITDVLGIHNAPYLTSFLARQEPPPINTVGVKSGTYVGSGTVTVLTIELVGVHWLWIRNTATREQTFWYTSMIGPHKGLDCHEIFSNNMVKAEANFAGNTVITIVGTDVAANAAGVTYQYIALSDPLSMIMLNGAFKHVNGATFDNTLFNPAFTPEGAFFFTESNENTLSGNGAIWKGPGNSANGAKAFETGAEDANGATFTPGIITSRAQLHGGTLCTAFSAFRSNDGTTPDVVVLATYTGDGTGNRNIALPLKGRRPLWAFVQPMTGSAVMRDASHTLTDSTRALTNVAVVNGIIGGGVDLIQVGTNLNTNLVVYSVFVIPACTEDVGNGGWGVDGICALNIGGWDPNNLPPFLLDPPEIPADVGVVGEGGLVLNSAAPFLAIKDMSGIYTLVPGKTDDTVYDRQTGQTSVDLEIPDPTIKTGFV